MLHFLPLGQGDSIAVTLDALNKVIFSLSPRDIPARFCWFAPFWFLLGINISLSSVINAMWDHSRSLKLRICKTYKHLQELQDQGTFLAHSLRFVSRQTALFTTFLTGGWAALLQETTCTIRHPTPKLLCCPQCPSASSACSLLSRPARILLGECGIHLGVN